MATGGVLLRLGCVLSIALLSARPLAAQAQGAFDGTWSTIITCAAAPDGAAGYTLRFASSVTGGVLHGETGVRGQAGYLALDGQITRDGSALLSAQGLTGNPDYVIGRLHPATPYSYQLLSRFDAAHGTGSRTRIRRCDAVFSKQ